MSETALAGRPAHEACEIAVAITARHLVPAEWLTNQSGVLQTVHGTLHVRYSPSTLSVEVISIPASHADGPAILIRIPDDENIAVGPRYFESMQLVGVLYPGPFVPITDIISSGWRERCFTQRRDPAN